MSGEFELIGEIRERAARAGVGGASRLLVGSGDDAAVTAPAGVAATSVDAAVEGVHFRREWSSPREIGAKAVGSALSDLAAMGAGPGELYIQLGLPPRFADPDVLELADGAIELAASTGFVIAGGDLVASPQLFVAVTAVGYAAEAERLVTRGGAQPGELLAITGELGGAAAGLTLLERPELGAALDAGVAASLRSRQLRAWPRLEAGALLASSGAGAMIDVSDGLGADARHLADASGVAIEIDLEAVPVQEGVEQVAGAQGVEAAELILGGEDYELLASLPPGSVEAATERLAGAGVALTPIGRIGEGSGLELGGASPRSRDGLGFRQRR